MKKVSILINEDVVYGFKQKESLHKEYEKITQKKIAWHLLPNFLKNENIDYELLFNSISESDIFICDSDNIGCLSQKSIHLCNTIMKEMISKLKKKNPKIKIFFKIFSFTDQKQVETLSKYGEIIEEWLDEKIVKALTDSK